MAVIVEVGRHFPRTGQFTKKSPGAGSSEFPGRHDDHDIPNIARFVARVDGAEIRSAARLGAKGRQSPPEFLKRVFKRGFRA